MYAGRLVEVSPVDEIFSEPLHPYTKLLIASLPSLDERGSFHGIPGLPPSLLELPTGCSFHPRCPYAMPRCSVDNPQMQQVRAGRWLTCHLYDDDAHAGLGLTEANGSASDVTQTKAERL
jgi:oligopeptide transport system ATP-binding protein